MDSMPSPSFSYGGRMVLVSLTATKLALSSVVELGDEYLMKHTST